MLLYGVVSFALGKLFGYLFTELNNAIWQEYCLFWSPFKAITKKA